ncbi:exosporium leader peptide [Bacillus sp. 31A1R]|uniref:Exosporium leader peptide n=1 Tax=Robertmurraya mangrovi TaxID=3098077 RepID=A0ABU5IYZ7_9BACI|nr:exosporium leader peptide [Bacillus sp. 31A1R]MDZ5472336.1 exosporium leader peptide [Bacillus sp. 31A1R]
MGIQKTPAYGSFWSDEFQTVGFDRPFSFSFSGPTSGGVTLTDPNTILVENGGDYLVTYTVTWNPQLPVDTNFYTPVINITINGIRVPNTQIRFGQQYQYVPGVNDFSCFELHGEAIIEIPDGTEVRLINDSIFNRETIRTCDNGINAAALNLVKLSI